MLKSLVGAIDCTLLPLLVMGLFASSLHRRAGWRPLWRGACLGALSALILVVLKRNTGFVVREYYNLALLAPMLLAEALLLLHVLVKPWGPESSAPGRAFKAVAFLAAALWTAYHLPDPIFLFLDFRVGLDDVFNSVYAFRIFGYAVGLLLVGIAMAAAGRAAAQLPPRLARPLFFLALAVFSARHLLALSQTLLGRGLIPRNRFLMRITIDLINHEAWFLYVLMALAGLAAVLAAVRSRGDSFAAGNPAAVRKLKAAARSRRRWRTAALASLSLALLAVTAGDDYSKRENVPLPPLDVKPVAGGISIPLARIDDGHLYRFRHLTPDGLEIRFIAIKKNETAYGVGLDACDVCGATGYYERSGQVICMLCDVVMNKSTIGFPGGCNPVPLKHRIGDGELRILAEDLEAQAWRFR